MDNIKEIAIANIAKILCDDLDIPNEGKWEKVFKCAGQRQYYENNESQLQPFHYKENWRNANVSYNPFSVVDKMFMELYNMGNIEALAKLIAEMVVYISEFQISEEYDKVKHLNNNLNLLGFELTCSDELCTLAALSSGSVNRIKDVVNLSEWLEKFFPNTSGAYSSAVNNYAQGNAGACVGECRVVLTGFYSYFKETKNWFNGVLSVTKDITSPNDYKNVGKIFKDSSDGEYTRFKAVYRIYSMLSDLGTHRDEGTVEKTSMSDALMCMRMTEDILIFGMMNNLEREI